MTNLVLTVRPGRNGAPVVDVSGPNGIVRSIPLVRGSKPARHVAGFVAVVQACVNAVPAIAAAAPPPPPPAPAAVPRVREDA